MSWDDLTTDLGTLADALRKVQQTERTGDALRMVLGGLENTWRTSRSLSYEGSGLPIPPPRDKGLVPTACCVEEAHIKFEFALGDDFDTRRVPRRADFQVRVAGFALYGDHCFLLEDHWRVDTDISEGTAHEIHPFFHFQRGGHAQKEFVGSSRFIPGAQLSKEEQPWHGWLQTPGPRIPTPPLCPLLALDFVIGQHDGTVWKSLRNLPEYHGCIARAQARLWSPFFEGLSSRDFRELWLGPMLIRQPDV